jgi:hypothetical protein
LGRLGQFRCEHVEQSGARVAFYAAYVAFSVLDAGDSADLDVVGPATLIVAPPVAMTYAVTGFQGWRRHRRTRVLDA